MGEFTIGIDIAKHVFQLHGVDAAGIRSQRFSPLVRPVLWGMEACGTAHFWAREIAASGHDVRLMPPVG